MLRLQNAFANLCRVVDEPEDDRPREDLDGQCARLEQAFTHGWVTPAHGPVTFDGDDLARIERVREHGGWLNQQEHDYLRWLDGGGRLGDPLPPAAAERRPFIRGIGDDFEVRLAGSGDARHVEILFSYRPFPGVRFGHRFPPPDESDGYEDIWLMEEVETGDLHRLMRRHPAPDEAGIVWTDWGWPGPADQRTRHADRTAD